MSSPAEGLSFELSDEDLERLFRLKYGSPDSTGWGPRLRLRAGYFNPDDRYEALIEKLVGPDCRWLDVGCGRSLFPSNEKLAKVLAQRCFLLVGVDPDATLLENPFVHKKISQRLDDFRSDTIFDLVTMRMVAEHVENPASVACALARCTKAGSLLVIYTVNRFSPVPLLTRLTPFKLHHPIKAILWGTERTDTFPTAFRMNTRHRLRKILGEAGFRERYFDYLDDCRTTGGVMFLQRIELCVWRCLKRLGLRYPENCLLAVFEKTVE